MFSSGYIFRGLWRAALLGAALVAAACDWHIFPYKETEEDWVSKDHLIRSLEDIAGTWRNGDSSLILSYTAGDPAAYLTIGNAAPITAELPDLHGKTPLVKGEFLIYWESQTGEGDWVMVCIRDDYRIIAFIDRRTNEERADTLRRG